MNLEHLEKLAKQCDTCIKKKPKQKSKCTIWYSIVVKKYPDVIKQLPIFLHDDWTCKGYDDGQGE